MKKIQKNRFGLEYLILVILFVAGLFFISLFYIRFSFNNGFSKLACDIKGGKWLNFGQGPTGCYKEYPDGGKICTSGSECVSKNCVISGLYYNGENKPMEKLSGECPSFGPLDSEYSILCGSAKIEEGKVVEDKRSCMY